MALIKCTGCSAPVSPQAASCPRCGNPIKAKQTMTGLLAAVIFALVLIVAFVYVAQIAFTGSGL